MTAGGPASASSLSDLDKSGVRGREDGVQFEGSVEPSAYQNGAG